MQKKLLTLAVAGALAAPAAALAQVEVYGTIQMSINYEKYGDSTSGIPGVSKSDVASHASNIGVRARENLGGGLSAWVQVETNASMERSNNIAHTSNFASRNSAIGLQGNWGNFFAGQWTTPWADLDALWGIGTVATYGPITSIIGRRETTGSAPGPNCANAGSGVGGVGANCDSVEGAGGVGHPFWRRISNSIHYQSPVFGGAQIKVAYQTNQDKQEASPGVIAADPSLWSASVTWAGMGGRLRVGAAYDIHDEFTTVGESDDGWRITGGYNFGFADVGFAYEEMTYKIVGGDCKATQWGVQVAIPIGQGAIRGAYSQADDIDGTYLAGAVVPGALVHAPTACGASLQGAGVAGDNGAKQFNIGYDYRFSKRTTVGVGYAKIDNDAGASFTWSGLSASSVNAVTPPAGSDVEIFFVSMIHRF
jgi:predicted porin